MSTQILTAAEIEAMLARVGRGRTAARNRALLVVLWRAGLRGAEALALAPHDVDPDRRTIRVRRGKGGRARTVSVDHDAADELRHWLELRRRLPLGPTLFCTLAGRPIHPSYLRQLVPRLAARAGIEKRVHPHAFRHTHAVELARDGWPLYLIQAQLGHANVRTTSVYLAHHELPELVAAAGRRPSWRTARGSRGAPADVHPSRASAGGRMTPGMLALCNHPRGQMPSARDPAARDITGAREPDRPAHPRSATPAPSEPGA